MGVCVIQLLCEVPFPDFLDEVAIQSLDLVPEVELCQLH